MTTREQTQAFWQIAFDDKVTACEITFSAWRHAIEAAQNNRQRSSLAALASGLERAKQDREAGYREARQELAAWVRAHPYPVKED